MTLTLLPHIQPWNVASVLLSYYIWQISRGGLKLSCQLATSNPQLVECRYVMAK